MAGWRLSKRLTARTVETLNKPGRHAHGDGLYLTVRPGGSKQWIFLYRSGGRLRKMGLGSQRRGLQARQLAADARRRMTNGPDPLEAHGQAEEQAKTTALDTRVAVNTVRARIRSSDRLRTRPIDSSAQKFLSTHAAVCNTFNLQRDLTSAETPRTLRAAAMETWRATVAVA